MQMYVMRHGTTEWNEQGITQGRTNNLLSARGVAQTEAVAKEYADVEFDAIYVSPLMRTRQTASIMNAEHNVPVIKDDRLLEIDQGIFAGRSKDGLTPEEKMLKKTRGVGSGMESFESALQRARDFVEDMSANCPYEKVLVITHNIIAGFLEDVLLGIEVDFNTNKHIREFKNAEIKLFDTDKIPTTTPEM